MEQRIKTVWILTIITALLMIGGQSYWLYNQYCYSAEEYMQKLHKEILQLEKEELDARFDKRKDKQQYALSYNMQGPDSVNRQGKTTCKVSFYRLRNEKCNIDSLIRHNACFEKDSIVISDSFHIENKSNEIIFDAVTRYGVEITSPFDAAKFDSLLQANGIELTDIKTGKSDSILWNGSYTPFRELLVSKMHIVYPYNPLQRKVLTATVHTPLPPLIRQMAWQLLSSLLLALLLIFCLIYQIKTILKQRKIDEMRKSFVNTMIHELKRPVQTLKMCVAFLNNKSMRTDEKAMDEVLKDSMFELDNLSAYLAKVRDMTRADYEHTPLNIRTFDLCETIDKLIRLSNAPANKQVTIIPHYEMESPLVTADAVHLANIISNLIENAIKYSGTEVHIHISCTLQAHTLTLCIADNGIGIPATEQGKIFDKFYRGSNLPDYNIPGIGLGLSYVKLLTEAHHGHISLSSQPGEGTTFTIVIPQ
ncbi:sensor histidine kinase [Phocaeicola sp.]